MSDNAHRCGVIAIAGRPNVGKSTLLNRILGAKIAIVTPKPQTTRDRILGIWSQPSAQILFHDTPGIHVATKALNRRMVMEAQAALDDADAILMMTDASDPATCLKQDNNVINRVRESGKPAVLAINKIDLIEKASLLPLIETYSKAMDFKAIIPISAQDGDGIDNLTDLLVTLIPKGPAMYPDDDLSDRPLRFLVAEIVREKLMLALRHELPYSTAVTIEEFIEPAPPAAVRISALIHVERASQKGIVIGKQGAMLKEIGTAARHDIQDLVGRPVMLTLFVRVDEDWTTTDKGLSTVLDN